MIKKILWALLALFILANLFIIVTGKTFVYKALVYTYVDIDDYKIFHQRIIKANNPREWNIGYDYNSMKLPDSLNAHLAKLRTVAFLIVKDDSIRYEHYWDYYSDSSLSNPFSVSKSIVSILAGIALKEGKIKSLDQPVGDFIPEFKEAPKSNITIRHLLTMSAGLDWDEHYTALFSQVTEAYYGNNLYKQVTSIDAVTEPGKELDYQSGVTQLLAFVIMRATGKSLSDYASEKLWTPLNAMHDAQWSLDKKNGNEKAYCCFYSNARDFARIGKLYLDSGKWNGAEIVPVDFVMQSITPAVLNDQGNPNTRYGYQWWLSEINGKPVFYARGILGQYIFVIPHLKLVAVRLGHERDETRINGVLAETQWYFGWLAEMFKESAQ